MLKAATPWKKGEADISQDRSQTIWKSPIFWQFLLFTIFCLGNYVEYSILNIENYIHIKNMKRNAFYDCKNIIANPFNDKIVVLSGLSSTGKSTILGQLHGYFGKEAEKITIESENDVVNLKNKIEQLKNNGKKYFFIDEITIANDLESALNSLK